MSAGVRAGLVLLGALSLLGVAGLALTDGVTPPMEVAVVDALLGALSLVLLWPAWRGSRRAMIALVVTRLVSVATTLPAFVVPDVPVPVRVLAAVLVLLGLLGCALVVPALRTARTG